MPVPAEARRIERQEIRRRYRTRRRPQLSAIRLRELNALLTARHGAEQLPDNADVRRAIVIIAHHLASLPAHPRTTISSWISLRAPWFTMGETEALVLEVVAKPRRWKAHSLAWALRLTAADRKALHITTIGACDLSPAERDAHRKVEAKRRAAAIRRARGAIPRAEYLAAVAAPQPWAVLGISRRTWYRRGKPHA